MASANLNRKTKFNLDDCGLDLVNLNWYSIRIDNKDYSYKCLFEDESYQLILFDLFEFKLFYLKKNKDELLETFKKLNPALEAPLSKILAHVKENFSNENTSDIFSINNENTDQNILHVLMKTKLSGVKFFWEFKFKLQESIAIKEHLVIPLLFNNAEYQLRENELIKIIQNKDKETDDYRSQGAKLSRKYLSTDAFSLDSFNESTKKKSEVKELIESPQKSIHTSLSHKVNEICALKYYSYLKQNQQMSQPNEKKIVEDDEKLIEASQESEVEAKTSSSQSQKKEQNRLRELELKLQAEEAKKNSQKAQIKKKKLF